MFPDEADARGLPPKRKVVNIDRHQSTSTGTT